MANKKNVTTTVNLRYDSWVDEVVKDPSNPPASRLMQGFVGKSSIEDHFRLYLDVELTYYADIPLSSLLYAQSLNDELGGSKLWISAEADIKTGPQTSDSRNKNRFLEGNIIGSHTSGDTEFYQEGKDESTGLCPSGWGNFTCQYTRHVRCTVTNSACSNQRSESKEESTGLCPSGWGNFTCQYTRHVRCTVTNSACANERMDASEESTGLCPSGWGNFTCQYTRHVRCTVTNSACSNQRAEGREESTGLCPSGWGNFTCGYTKHVRCTKTNSACVNQRNVWQQETHPFSPQTEEDFWASVSTYQCSRSGCGPTP